MSARWLMVSLAALCGAGCDRPGPPQSLRDTAVATARTTTAPLEPREPSYEDAQGTVFLRGGGWIIEVPGEKTICLPFEAPADVRKNGQNVRFTLYLSDAAPGRCREVGTFVSARVVE